MMLGALLAGALLTQGEGPISIPIEVADVLVVTIRDRESKLGPMIPTSKELRKKFEPRGYAVFNVGQRYLLYDRAILEGTSGVLTSRAAEFFAARGYEPTTVGELPAGVREAVVDYLTASHPQMTREQAATMPIALEGAVYADLNNPPGIPSQKNRVIQLGAEALRGQAAPPPLPPAPALTAEGNEARPASELRMFTLRGERGARAIELWDILRPVVKEHEAKLRAEAFARTNPLAVAVREWFEAKTGLKRREEKNFSALSKEGQAAISEGLIKRRDSLADTRIVLGAGHLRFRVNLGRGEHTFPLNGIGR